MYPFTFGLIPPISAYYNKHPGVALSKGCGPKMSLTSYERSLLLLGQSIAVYNLCYVLHRLICCFFRIQMTAIIQYRD